MAGFDPQTDVQVAMVSIADADVATSHEQIALICPLNVGCELEVLSISCAFETLPTAANIAANIHDASADTDAVYVAATDVVTSQSVMEGQELVRKHAILSPGDTVTVVLTGVTAGSVRGLSIAVEYRVTKHS